MCGGGGVKKLISVLPFLSLIVVFPPLKSHDRLVLVENDLCRIG